MTDGGVELNPTIDFLAGTISGIAGLVVGYPFDTVKVRFQDPTMRGKYSSTMNALGTIMKEERFIGLYKGIMSPLATTALMNGLVFASYRFLMKIQLDNGNSIPTLTEIALAGAGSGIISSIITTPTELIKIRQQQLLTRSSTRDVAMSIIRAHGLRGMYRGMPVTALRDCGYGAYFWAYEATCRYFTTPTLEAPADEIQLLLKEVDGEMRSVPGWAVLMVAGGLAGIAGWVTTFPLDVVKTRMQGHSPIDMIPTSSTPLLQPSEKNPYRTMWGTILHSFRTEGVGVFFRGLAPTLIRAIPVNIATFATFEAVVHAVS